jgi:hypothetical protein
MALSLVGGNVEAAAADAGTYTWADVLAVGAAGITQTNGVTTINNVRIRMRGTATLNITNQVIVCIVSSVSATFLADGQSTIRFGAKATVSGRETYRDGCEITFRSSLTSGDADRDYISMNFGASNAKIFCYATTIRAVRLSGNIRCDFWFTELIQSQVISDGWSEGVFIILYDAAICSKNIFFRTRAVEMAGTTVSSLAVADNTFYDCPATFQLFDTGATVYTIEGLDAVGFGAIAGVVRGSFRFLDPAATFTLSVDLMVADFTWVGGAFTPQTSYKSYSHTLKTSSSGSAINNALVTYTNATLGSLAQTTDASGLLATSFVLDVENTNNQYIADDNRYFTDPAAFPNITTISTPTWTREIRSYLHRQNTVTLTVSSKVGSTDFPFEIDLTVDDGVTESNTTTVGAYSGISNSTGAFTLSGTLTLNQVYDSRKLYWRNNNGSQLPVKSGDVASFGSANITFSGSTASPAATSKYAQFSTTGTITLGTAASYARIAAVSGMVIDVDACGATLDLSDSSNSFADGTVFRITDGGSISIAVADSGLAAQLEADKNQVSGTIVFTAPVVTFSAAGIGASGAFNNIRCRTSFYKRATFPTSDVNTTTNRITIAGLSGRISANSYVRFYGTDLPAPLDQNNRYFIHDFSGNAFSLSATQGGGGTQVDLTDVGSGDMIAIVLTELDIQLVTDGSYEFSLSAAQSTAGIDLSTNDQLLFQAVHWAGSLQSVDPPVASKYHEELQVYSGASISTLAQLQPYTEHDTFAIQENTDGYEISQLTVTGSSPTRHQWRVDASAPGLVQIESEDPDRVISSALAVLYFQFVQWSEPGLRLFRGEIEAENLNSIVIDSPEVGTSAVLTVESFPAGVPLLVNGPGMYRADGKTWIATGSPIQHQPTALVAVPIPVEVPINLSEPVMSMLHTMLAALTVQADTSSGGGGATDWTSTERQHIRNRLGIDGSAATPSATPTLATAAALTTLTTTVGTAGAGLTEAGGTGDQFTALPWNAAWDAEVQSEVTDALSAYETATGGDVTAAQTAIINQGNTAWVTANVSGLATSTALTTLGTAVDLIKAKTDVLTFTGSDVRATLDGETVSVGDKTGFSLTSGERTAIATAVEAALINEGDGQQLIDAILDVINSNLDLPALELTAIAQAVRSELATELGRIDAAITSRLATTGYTAPDNAGITTLQTRLSSLRAGYLDKLDVSGTLAHTDNANTFRADVSALATTTQLNNRTLLSADYATSTALATVDAVVDGIAVQTTRVDGLIENSSGNRFTTKALEQAPSGGGSSSASDIYSYFTTGTRADAFKADIVPISSAIALIPTNPLLTNDSRIADIKTKTDQLVFSGGDIVATLNGEEVVISTAGVNAIVAGVNGALTIPTAVQIRTEIDSNSTQLTAIRTIATGAKNAASAGL